MLGLSFYSFMIFSLNREVVGEAFLLSLSASCMPHTIFSEHPCINVRSSQLQLVLQSWLQPPISPTKALANLHHCTAVLGSHPLPPSICGDGWGSTLGSHLGTAHRGVNTQGTTCTPGRMGTDGQSTHLSFQGQTDIRPPQKSPWKVPWAPAPVSLNSDQL